MSVDENGSKHAPSGTPEGGQFATQPKAPPSTSLTPAQHAKVEIMGVATLDDIDIEPLPQWPESLPGPSTSYSWDEDGALEVVVSFGSETLTVWGAPGDAADSFREIPGERPDVPRDVADQVAAYGHQLHSNVSDLTAQVQFAANTPAVRAAVLASASGQDQPVKHYDSQDPTSHTPAQRATARAEAALTAWSGGGEPDIHNALVDLLHFADSQGITPAQFGGIFHSAQLIQRDQVENSKG